MLQRALHQHWFCLLSTKERIGRERKKRKPPGTYLTQSQTSDLTHNLATRTSECTNQLFWSILIGLTKIPAWKTSPAQVSPKPVCLHKQLLFSESSKNSSLT